MDHATVDREGRAGECLQNEYQLSISGEEITDREGRGREIRVINNSFSVLGTFHTK